MSSWGRRILVAVALTMAVGAWQATAGEGASAAEEQVGPVQPADVRARILTDQKQPPAYHAVLKKKVDRQAEWFWIIAPVASLLALGFAWNFYGKLMADSEGTDKMKEIAKHVREGAYAYLYSQYRVVSLVFLPWFVS